LVAAQAPEHFIDLELADALGPLPHKRFDFEAMVFAAGQRPEKIGLQPWETDEVWERLKAAMRQYRHLGQSGRTPKGGSGNHFLCRLARSLCRRRLAAAPRHRTVQRLGWANPHGYTTDHQIHHQFEGPFVAANMHAPDVQAKMTSPVVIQGDMFDAYLAYLRHTAIYVEQVYQFDKAGPLLSRHTRVARLYRRAASRRRKHVSRHDLHSMD